MKLGTMCMAGDITLDEVKELRRPHEHARKHNGNLSAFLSQYSREATTEHQGLKTNFFDKTLERLKAGFYALKER